MFEDNTFVVSGAGSGIGFSITKKLLLEKSRVVALIRNTNNALEELKKVYSNQLTIFEIDLRNESDIVLFGKKLKDFCVEINGLVNCAGVVQYEMFRLFDTQKLNEMIDVNLKAVLLLMRAMIPYLKRTTNPSIVNISSSVSLSGVSGQLNYSATKGAVNALTYSAAKELGSMGIRVNAIAPGMVATDRLLKNIEEKFASNQYNIALGRLAQPEEIADVCAFLLSDKSSYITGQVLRVDGGLVL